MNGSESSEPIPIDLVIQIFSRLPLKSLGRCHCLSKLWAYILSRPYFKELFMTRSSARPQLLFRCRKNGEDFFFSSPQPQSHDVKSSLMATNLHKNSPVDGLSEFCSHVNGLVCLIDERMGKGITGTVHVICDPSTGRSLALPMVDIILSRSFLGYDPIDKQFKLLSTEFLGYMHQILTLGTRKLSWRTIECSIRNCYSLSSGICIKGVVYYPAKFLVGKCGIVCFDVRSEKFKFTEKAKIKEVTLVNYKGKLATLKSNKHCTEIDSISGKSTSFQLCVLQDAEKHEWSKYIYVLPSLWKDIVSYANLRIVGVTRSGEVVLTRYYGEKSITGSGEVVLSSSNQQTSRSFCLIYYNLERNTIRKIIIQGMGDFKRKHIHTFLDHVENVNLGEVFRTS